MAEEKNTQFNYLLNAMEHAAREAHPAKAGYAGKRKALMAHVRELERDAARYRWLCDKSNIAPDDTPTVYSARKDGRILYGAGLNLAVDLAAGVSEPLKDRP